MFCTLLTSASVASSIRFLLSPMIAGLCTEGFELRAFQHFVFNLIVSLKYSLLVWFLTLLFYWHWQHKITAFHSVDNLALHFSHTPSAWTSQPLTYWNSSLPVHIIMALFVQPKLKIEMHTLKWQSKNCLRIKFSNLKSRQIKIKENCNYLYGILSRTTEN